MSRVYISFKSNIQRIDPEKFGMAIDYVTFKTAEGEVSLSSENYSDNALNDAGDFDCRWRGVAYSKDGSDDAVTLDDKMFSTIGSTGVIDAIGIYLTENTKINGDTIKISDVEISVENDNCEGFKLVSDGSNLSIEIQ